MTQEQLAYMVYEERQRQGINRDSNYDWNIAKQVMWFRDDYEIWIKIYLEMDNGCPIKEE